ncbi:MAG: type II secretion system GspH family protein [Muribaculaceae bacterium]|nr:type II secretion system GspH family protein [Muribaculaceae bacterium]
MSLKRGFTLAEVLITLGIIGVVAAMTIPNLIADARKRAIENQLKKSYASITNAIRLAEIDNGSMDSWPTGADMNMEEYWKTYFLPYFRGARLCKNKVDCGYPADLPDKQWSNAQWNMSTGNSRLLFQLMDGTVVFFPRNTFGEGGKPSYVETFYMDVNGNKKPNTYCQDFFTFSRNGEKGIHPIGCTVTLKENGWHFPPNYEYKF